MTNWHVAYLGICLGDDTLAANLPERVAGTDSSSEDRCRMMGRRLSDARHRLPLRWIVSIAGWVLVALTPRRKVMDYSCNRIHSCALYSCDFEYT